MKINTQTRYGLKALVFIIEKLKEQDLVSTKEISENTTLPLRYLEQILHKLKNSDILKGYRGSKGGYKLLRDAAEITILDVFTAIEEEEQIIKCDYNKKKCITRDSCTVRFVWAEMNENLKESMKKISLQDIVDKGDAFVNANS